MRRLYWQMSNLRAPLQVVATPSSVWSELLELSEDPGKRRPERRAEAHEPARNTVARQRDQ